MKRAIRNTAVLILSAPLAAAVHILALFRGRAEAVRLVGPLVTALSKASLRFWVPTIQDASEFNAFRQTMRTNIRRWRLLYDVRVVEDAPDRFEINVLNCPFCEVFPLLGLRELNEYFCRADWKLAEEHQGLWTFERTRTIAAGDGVCDHTYRRFISEQR